MRRPSTLSPNVQLLDTVFLPFGLHHLVVARDRIMTWVHLWCYLMLHVFYKLSSSLLEDIQHGVLSLWNSCHWVWDFLSKIFFCKCVVLIFSPWMLFLVDLMSHLRGPARDQGFCVSVPPPGSTKPFSSMKCSEDTSGICWDATLSQKKVRDISKGWSLTKDVTLLCMFLWRDVQHVLYLCVVYCVLLFPSSQRNGSAKP